jgi:hypothetical protein
MSITLTHSEADMLATAPSPFRPLPITRIASVRRRILRELPEAFRNPDCMEIIMHDGSSAKRFKSGARECLVTWASGSGAPAEILRW